MVLECLEKKIDSLCSNHEGMAFDDVTQKATIHDRKANQFEKRQTDYFMFRRLCYAVL
jgi:hypothetical protein